MESINIDRNYLVRELIGVYETYLKEGLTDKVKSKAEEIYSRYLTAGPVLDKNVREALDYLSAFTEWGQEISEKTKLKKVSRKRAGELFNKLKVLESNQPTEQEI